MTAIDSSEYYENNRRYYDDYLQASRRVRGGQKIAGYSAAIGFFLMIIVIIFNIQGSYLGRPELSFQYLLTVLIFVSLIGGVLFLYVFGFLIGRKKIEYSYDDINVSFIHIYEAHQILYEYTQTSRIILKKKFVQSIKEHQKILRGIIIGNIRFVRKILQDKINFLANDFQHVALTMFNSNNNDDHDILLIILSNLYLFLHDQSFESLDRFYTHAIEYNIERSQIMNVKNSFKNYVDKYPSRSQFFFTICLAVLIYLVGIQSNADIINIIGWMITASIGSFTIFDKIKKLLV